jgi:hypothetical protein
MSIIAIIGLAFIAAGSFAIGSGTNSASVIATGVFFLTVPALYFAPAFIAHRRSHANKTAIVVLNVFLGWTLIGWVAALVWAHSTANAAEPASQILAGRVGGVRPSQVEGQRACPFCAETIKAAAIKCRFCGSTVDSVKDTAQLSPAATSAAAVATFAPGDMACKNCAKHIPIDGVKCPYCGHPSNA